MTTTIHIDENTIMSGNVDKVKRTLEAIVENSEMIRRYEANIALFFGSSEHKRQWGFFDLEKKLAQPAYKRWFRQLDQDIPALAYFLSVAEGQNSLLVYLMGVLDYRVVESRVEFDPLHTGRFLAQKKTEIKNLCLSNNINPQASIQRLSTLVAPSAAPSSGAALRDNSVPPSPQAVVSAPPPAVPVEGAAEKQKETQPLKDLLDRYGSIAVFKENRMTKLFLVLGEIPAQIQLKRNELVFDRSLNRWFFRTLFLLGDGERAIESLLLYKPGEVADSITAHGGVLLMCVCRSDDGEYQKLFEIEEPVPTAIVEEEGGVTPPPVQPASDEGDKHDTPDEPPAAKEPADSKDREIAALKAEVERLKGIIDAYEETMLGKNKKNIFKKFFG
ncbi:MAG TPA: hypothetical protein PLV42_10815 [bacterium]|nr:hypothetical protein [bacterium]